MTIKKIKDLNGGAIEKIYISDCLDNHCMIQIVPHGKAVYATVGNTITCYVDTRSTKITLEWGENRFILIPHGDNMFYAVKRRSSPIIKTTWRRGKGELNSCNLLREV